MERLFQGNTVLNSDNSASKSAESVEHSINCKDYLGTEMPMCSVVSLKSLFCLQLQSCFRYIMFQPFFAVSLLFRTWVK